MNTSSQYSRPPALPGEMNPVSKEIKTMSSFERDFNTVEDKITFFKTIELLLKHPARLTYEITKGRLILASLLLLLVTIICMTAYGFIMGLFSGGPQLWLVPAKVSLGLLFSALLCLPSLYIFICLSGGTQKFSQVIGLFLQALALTGVLLVGFAPISWIFSQSTNAVSFMGVMHLMFWAIATSFSLQLLSKTFSFLNKRQNFSVKIWCVIFIAVVVQMTTTLRPLVGEADKELIKEKKFFLTHWSESFGE
jgi:hypothetical protein